MASSLPIIGGVASGVAGMFGASKASSAAESAANQQAAIAKAQLELAREQWQRYMQAFAPLENTLIKESQQPARQNQGYLAMMGGLNRNYADASANMRRMMGGRTPHGSGMETAKQDTLERGRIRDLGQLESQWNQNRLSNMMDVANIGRSLPAQAQAGYGSAMAGYGNLSNMYGNLSQNAWGGVGNSFGNLAQMWMLGHGSQGNPYSLAGSIMDYGRKDPYSGMYYSH